VRSLYLVVLCLVITIPSTLFTPPAEACDPAYYAKLCARKTVAVVKPGGTYVVPVNAAFNVAFDFRVITASGSGLAGFGTPSTITGGTITVQLIDTTNPANIIQLVINNFPAGPAGMRNTRLRANFLNIPANTFGRFTIRVIADINFSADGCTPPTPPQTLRAVGDNAICIVPETSPGSGVASLDLIPRSNSQINCKPGEQFTMEYQLVNNTGVERTIDILATSRQQGRMPEMVNSGGGADSRYSISTPFIGDDFPIVFTEDLPANGHIPTSLDKSHYIQPPLRHTYVLAGGETRIIRLTSKSHGACLDGSCSEYSLVATSPDGGPGFPELVACAGASAIVSRAFPGPKNQFTNRFPNAPLALSGGPMFEDFEVYAPSFIVPGNGSPGSWALPQAVPAGVGWNDTSAGALFPEDPNYAAHWQRHREKDWIYHTNNIVTFENNTPFGTQSLENISFFRAGYNNQLLIPLGRHGGGPIPTSMQASVKVFDSFTSYVLRFGDGDVDIQTTGALALGGIDASFLTDDFLYTFVHNPNFDPTMPTADVKAPNAIFNGTDNRPVVPAPLSIDGLSPYSIPAGVWVTYVIQPDQGINTFMLDQGAGFTPLTIIDPLGFFMGAQIQIFSDTNFVDRMRFESSSNIDGLLSTLYLDDVIVDGGIPFEPSLVQFESGLISNPVFDLPYTDDFSSYSGASPELFFNKGFTPFLGRLYQGLDERLAVTALAAPPLAGVSSVRRYSVQAIEAGTFPGVTAPGDIFAILDNLPDTDSRNSKAVPDQGSGTRELFVEFRDVSGLTTGVVRVLPLGGSLWDGVTPIASRYLFNFQPRYEGGIFGATSIENDPTSSGRGKVVSFRSPYVSKNSRTGALEPALTMNLPEVSARGGDMAVAEFDLWIDSDTTSPRGRMAMAVHGPGANGGLVAKVVFGGPNNFEDFFTFDEQTGNIFPGPDGFPDTFQQGDFQSDPSHIYLLFPNPFSPSALLDSVNGSDFTVPGPDYVLVDTLDTMPINTWVRVRVEVATNGDWVISINDGVSTRTFSGAALELTKSTWRVLDPVGAPQDVRITGNGPLGEILVSGGVGGIGHIQFELGLDEGSDGNTRLTPIEWYSLGQSASPEGGFDVLQSFVNDSLKYFYYEITSILPLPTSILPTVTEVNAMDGVNVGSRSMAVGDQVVLWNSQSTAGIGGPGMPINGGQTPRNSQFHFLDSAVLDGNPNNSSDVLARGTWIPLGLPGQEGVANPMQLGGIVANSPPYGNAVPFMDMLMGTMVGLPQPTSFAVPPFAAYVDNVTLQLVTSPCPHDLNSDGAVDGADLGLLLGNWGNPGASDLNNDGTTNGADLGLLLGAWGACP
jgi:hypothetical protein